MNHIKYDILPFDFYIPDLDLIIELDGDQHFEQVSNWTPCNKTREKDVHLNSRTKEKHSS